MSDSSDVDKKLGELLNVIKDSVESKKDGDYSSTVSGTSAIGTEDIGKNTEMQKFIANECMYHQLLIPVTPEVALAAEKSVRDMIKGLKALSQSPGLQKELSTLIPLLAGGQEAGRSTSEDPQFKRIVEDISNEVINTRGERVAPALGVVAWLVTAGGVATLGGAAGVIAKKIWNWL